LYIDLFVIFRDSDDNAQNSTSDESDNEILPLTKLAITPTNEKEDMDEDPNVQLTSHHWSFLSTILPDPQ